MAMERSFPLSGPYSFDLRSFVRQAQLIAPCWQDSTTIVFPPNKIRAYTHPRITVPTNRTSPRSTTVRRKVMRRSTHRGHVDDQLPERLVPRASIHVPQCIVHGAQCDVDDALLRANPAKQSTSSANNRVAHAKQWGRHMRVRSVAAWHGMSTWRG